MRRPKRRAVLFAALALLLAGLVSAAVYLKSLADYRQAVRETVVEGIDLSEAADGVYVGEHDVGFIYVRAEVTVENGTITDVELLEHRNGRGAPAEAVADEIVDQQRIDVDAVSGATNSSVVIEKAVENAVRQGLRPGVPGK